MLTNYFDIKGDDGQLLDPSVKTWILKKGVADGLQRRAEKKIKRYIKRYGEIEGWDDDGSQVDDDLREDVALCIADLLNYFAYTSKDPTVKAETRGERAWTYKDASEPSMHRLYDHITIDEDKILYYT